MSKILNKWLEPYRRSFDSIKYKLLQSLDNIKDSDGNPLITDKSEGNIFVLLISMFAAIAEVLHFYIDESSRESFLPTANRYDSLLRHAKLVDYSVKGATAPSVDVVLTRDSGDSGVKILHSEYLSDSKGNQWMPYSDYFFPKNSLRKTISLIQHRPIRDNSYTYSRVINDSYLIIDNIPSGELYEQGTMHLNIGSNEYTLVDTFAKSSPTDRHFKVEISESASDSSILIVFGDGVNGFKPNSSEGNAIELSYYVTKGAGALLSVGGIDTSWPSDNNITVKNNLPSSGGSNYEDFDTLKRRISNSIKTLDVAITKEDFKNLALTLPEIGQAAIEYECGRKLNIYIATIDGLSPNTSICNKVKNYILQHCPLTTWVDVKPVGITPLVLEATLTGKKSYKKDYIQNQVITALNNRYSAGNTQINEAVRLSDIYALIDNLESVDYLLITKFYLMPWPKRLSGGTQLSINTYTLNKCNIPQEYILVKKNGTWEVYSKYNNNSNLQKGVGNDINVEDVNNGNSFTLKLDNVPEDGSRYSIYVTYGESTTQDPGFNLPVINTNSNQVILNINETL